MVVINEWFMCEHTKLKRMGEVDAAPATHRVSETDVTSTPGHNSAHRFASHQSEGTGVTNPEMVFSYLRLSFHEKSSGNPVPHVGGVQWTKCFSSHTILRESGAKSDLLRYGYLTCMIVRANHMGGIASVNGCDGRHSNTGMPRQTSLDMIRSSLNCLRMLSRAFTVTHRCVSPSLAQSCAILRPYQAKRRV